MTNTEKRLELFREKFACKLENCCDHKNLADHFTVKEFEDFHTESIAQAKQEMLNSVRKEMACYECNGSGTYSTPSDHGQCESCAGTGFSIEDGSFNDLLSSIDINNLKK